MSTTTSGGSNDDRHAVHDPGRPAAAAYAAAFSRTQIGQGIALVNGDFGSLPFGATTFGRKTIVFTPTPEGGPDTPIVVRTGPDGRIVPQHTRRGGGEPPVGAVDYDVSMPRRDAHRSSGRRTPVRWPARSGTRAGSPFSRTA